MANRFLKSRDKKKAGTKAKKEMQDKSQLQRTKRAQKSDKSEPLPISQQESAQSTIAYSGLIEEYHDPRIAHMAIRIGAFAVVGFLGWAALAPVHELTIGQGTILPAGFVQQIQHLEGGNVAGILVEEGQQVVAGAPLIELHDVSARAELQKAMARLEFINLTIQRKSQDRTQGMTMVGNESGEFGELFSAQSNASSADQAFRRAQMEVIEAEVVMKSAELKSLQTRVAAISEEFQIVSKQLKDYENAFRTGAVSRRERDGVLRDKLSIESQKAALEGQLASAQAAVTEAKARASELRARFAQEAETQIADLEVQKAETQELVTQLKDRLDRTILRAPVDGTINNLSVRNVGQVVSPGEAVAELVPMSSSVFAEVDIPPDQIGFVREGMDANVKVLTFDFARFGAIEGTVVDVSPSSIANEQGEYFYRVRVALDTTYVGDPRDNRIVTPGMAVTADIVLGDKSVLSYLLKPLRAISDRAFSER